MTLVSTALLFGCSGDAHEDQHPENEEAHDHSDHSETGTIELTQKQFDLAGIKIGKPTMRPIGDELQVNGVIDVPPKGNVSISLPYGGFLKSTEMLPGSKVKKGQLLAVIENPEFLQFQEDYLNAFAKKESLEENYKRQEALFGDQVSSAKEFQASKSAYLGNEATLKTSAAKLEMIGMNPEKVRNGNATSSINLYAPVTGTVRDVHTNIGKYISPQQVVMDITNASDLHVELTVYENDLPKVKKGQRIRFAPSSDPENWREAEIFLVGSTVREDRSVTVHGHLHEPHLDLIPGMYLTARIETGTVDALAVPENAVQRYGGEQFVFVSKGTAMEDGEKMYRFEMVAVEKGNSEDGFTAVKAADKKMDLSNAEMALEGAHTLLAKAKNVESEGGGHGH